MKLKGRKKIERHQTITTYKIYSWITWEHELENYKNIRELNKNVG